MVNRNDILLLPKEYVPCVFVYLIICDYSILSPGELKTLQPLDREEQGEHRFKMRAVDGGGRYCEADIYITVEDVNDNPPQFSSDPYTITVFENTEMGTYVAKLLATDVDIGECNYSTARYSTIGQTQLHLIICFKVFAKMALPVD